MFKTRLFWFRKDEGDHVDREHKTEKAARDFAAERSNAVTGGCYVMRGDSVLAWYCDGEEATA